MSQKEHLSKRWDAAQRACRDGDLDTLEWLVENAKLFENRAGLRRACISGAWGSGDDRLIRHGEAFTTTDSIRLHTMLQTTTARGHIHIVQYLLEQFPAKGLHILEWEIILTAIGQAHVDLLAPFAKIDPDFVHMSGPQFGNCFTALFTLVNEREKHLPVVEFLLEHGARPDDGLPFEDTLEQAEAYSTAQVVQALHRAGSGK